MRTCRSRTSIAQCAALWLLCLAAAPAQQGGPPHKSAAELRADADALVASGMEHMERGSRARAESDFARAVSIDGQNVDSLTWYGYALHLRDANEEALGYLERAHRLDPDSYSALHLLASVELHLGRLQDALRHVDAAISLGPEVGEIRYTRNLILEALGRPAEAAAAAETAGRLDPDYRDRNRDAVDRTRALDASLVSLVILGSAVALLGILSLVGLATGFRRPAALARARADHTQARYDGTAADLFKVYLQNIVLTVVTLGIYRFWAKVRMTRYRYQHTTFAGGRFDYHGTGREKFVGFLKGMLILAAPVTGLYLAYLALEPRIGEDLAFTVCFWSFFLFMFLLRPLILVGSQRFNLGRTSWSNLRFRFTGRVGPAYRLYLRDLALMVVTFGFYFAWHECNVRRFRLQHTRMGDQKFDYRGDGGDLVGITLGGVLLSYATLGIYLPWYIARVRRYHVEHTFFLQRRFRSSLTGRHVMSVGAPALLAIVFSLGLAIPWALDRWWRLITETTSYPAPIDVDQVRSIHDQGAGAGVEGIGEAGEALSELGDLFGA